MGKIIGINQRISVTLIENGLKAVFDGVYSKEFARSLAEYEFQGENRLKKAVNELSKVVDKNSIIPFLVERKEQVMKAMQYKADRAIIVAALYNSAFPFSMKRYVSLANISMCKTKCHANCWKKKYLKYTASTNPSQMLLIIASLHWLKRDSLNVQQLVSIRDQLLILQQK
jgi:hypothetical protein